jgi:hypothetical protein
MICCYNGKIKTKKLPGFKIVYKKTYFHMGKIVINYKYIRIGGPAYEFSISRWKQEFYPGCRRSACP